LLNIPLNPETAPFFKLEKNPRIALRTALTTGGGNEYLKEVKKLI
jgi:hypothetical protein